MPEICFSKRHDQTEPDFFRVGCKIIGTVVGKFELSVDAITDRLVHHQVDFGTIVQVSFVSAEVRVGGRYFDGAK